MSKNREINFKEDLSILGQLNITNTALLATGKSKTEEYFAKAIYLGPEFYKRPFESNLKRLYGIAQPIIHKPERFAYD